jgi:hypothetical protein
MRVLCRDFDAPIDNLNAYDRVIISERDSKQPTGQQNEN